MDKLKMHSPNLTEENITKLASLFPNCVTESKDKTGTLKKSIDFDLLRQELSPHIVEGPQERYHLNWPGKREALLTANAPIAKTLRPCREESVNFDTTQNLFIEGDNLDALKLLQETYLGKIKMIYIDPPYNTGKDFIYADDFAENADVFLLRSNQKDEFGNKLVANPESNGRIHSDWLSMMYSRLKLSFNLLDDSGVIFISINHKEICNLRKIADEIFGETNMLCLFAWRTDGNFDNQAKFKYCHEYVIAYAKQETSFPHPLIVDPNIPEDSKIYRPEIRNTVVKNGPKNPPSAITLPSGFPAAFECGFINMRKDAWPHFLTDAQIEQSKLVHPADVYSGWSSKELLLDFINNGCKELADLKGQPTRFEITPTGTIEAIKVRGESSHVISMLTGFGGPQRATAEILELGVFFDDYPKPLELIEYFIKMNRGDEFVVLDFFAGSATTAHAVMKLNAEDGGNRKFIMVQLPEVCDEKSEAFKAGYKTIAEISKERIRRAGRKILEDMEAKANPKTKDDRTKDLFNDPSKDNFSDFRVFRGSNTLDTGFRVLKVDSGNMADIYYTPDALSQDGLFQLTDNIKSDRSEEDLLFQVLLDWGVDLTLPVTRETIADREVFFVDGNALAACFVKNGRITKDFCKTLAKRRPLRVVFRDAGFKDDSVKINVEQIFKLMSPHTDVRTI
ncbi:MAG: DNA methyltransferase [Desulfobacteraceae bacterium]|nr:DNA methyltransferase [Desulfobacteraceae bacterium]